MLTCPCGRSFTSEHSIRAHRKGCDGKRVEERDRAGSKRFEVYVRLPAAYASMLVELMEARGMKTYDAMIKLLIDEEFNA